MAVAHKGSISMGLVLIPVGLYKNTVDNDIHFNQLDKESKARIKYKKYCSHCNKEVGPDDIIKGYEYEKDKYVVMTDDAYELLRQALLSQKKVAIAKTVMGTNEKLLVLYPTKEGMIVKTLFYHDEIAAVPKQIPKVTLDKNELDMAKMLVDNMTKPFVPEDFKDEYQARLRDAIMKKIQGQEIVTADTSEPGNVIDLMEALQKSLEMSKGNGRKKTGTA